ncbi:hypothetical protein KGF54_001373 [Candida jiufengensis]|uniref:uncharacterized protein n=1 Tax=Candida jiufengensis TaxID=497108 RepID=UPI002224662F|nr:uncharacterized protein KGF54_001373 [Candida jiufengensis]KAI5955871.1 hypothetical protein KGF54_001373 [Candida jiufengensis]
MTLPLAIYNFKLTKYSKFESKNWIHYPQRSNLSISFNNSNTININFLNKELENDEIKVVIQFKGSNLDEFIILKSNKDKILTTVLAKSPSIGIKQINKLNGDLILRFQISLIDDDEYKKCLEFLKHCEIGEFDKTRNDNTISTISSSTIESNTTLFSQSQSKMDQNSLSSQFGSVNSSINFQNLRDEDLLSITQQLLKLQNNQNYTQPTSFKPMQPLPQQQQQYQAPQNLNHQNSMQQPVQQLQSQQQPRIDWDQSQTSINSNFNTFPQTSRYTQQHIQPNTMPAYANIPSNSINIPFSVNAINNTNPESTIYHPNNYDQNYQEPRQPSTNTHSSNPQSTNTNSNLSNLDEQLQYKILTEMKQLSNISDSNLRHIISKTCQIKEFKDFVERLDKVIENN